MLISRWCHGAVYHEHYLYVLGGIRQGDFLSKCEVCKCREMMGRNCSSAYTLQFYDWSRGSEESLCLRRVR
jgi:hypothetical protein